MIRRILGGLLLILGSIKIGCILIGKYRKEVQMLQQIDRMISNICCDLQFRMAPLPQLIRTETGVLHPQLKKLYLSFAEELEAQISPNALCCLDKAFIHHPDVPDNVKSIIIEMGRAFGRFDLDGQIKSLAAVKIDCERALDKLLQREAGYMKCCKAYSLCAGVLLALILL